MTGSDRRAVLAFLALAPAAVAWPHAASAGVRPGIPDGPFTLERLLERGLGHDASLTVTRRWLCHFVEANEGWRVEGQQLACDVKAPEKLAALAAMERARLVTGLFPALLDRHGLIVRGGDGGAGADLSRQFAEAVRLLGKAADDDQRSFIAALGQTAAGLVSEVPPDLFFPEAGGRTMERAVPVAGTSDGAISVFMTADCDPGTGLLRMCEKRVETRGGGEVRRACERWTLTRQ